MMLICPLADDQCREGCPHTKKHLYLCSCKPRSECGTKNTWIECVEFISDIRYDVQDES